MIGEDVEMKQDSIKQELDKKKLLKPPPQEQFAIEHPEIPIKENEIIKLTAMYVARNGQKFLA